MERLTVSWPDVAHVAGSGSWEGCVLSSACKWAGSGVSPATGTVAGGLGGGVVAVAPEPEAIADIC